MYRFSKEMVTVFIALAAVLTVAGPVVADQVAVSVNTAADFSSGAHSVISVNPVGGPRTVQNDLLPTISDIAVAAFGNHFYRIERFMGDNVTRFNIANPETPIWQYSTLDDGETVSSNPYAMIFAGPDKAYLLRFGKTAAWIVNPNAATEAEFKIGEIDLSAYADADGIPEMSQGIIVGGKLFVVVNRLDRNDGFAPRDAYLAVFDVGTDTEIVTGAPNDLGVAGIPLPMRNANSISFLAETGLIYIGFQGRFASSFSGTPAEYTGGILSLNPLNYAVNVVVDDGEGGNAPFGNFTRMEVISADKGYFVGYADFGDNTLYEFNPSTGAVSGVANEALSGKNITELAVDENGLLWVGNATDANFTILNPVENTLDEAVGTNLNPQRLTFADSDSTDAQFTYYLPYYVVGENLWTGVALRNMDGAKRADVTVVGYGMDGAMIFSDSRQIMPRGQSAFVAGTGAARNGWLKVMSSQPLSGLAFFGHSGAENYMADMNLESELAASLVIPHVAQDDMWDTTVMLCNPGEAASVTMTLVGPNGEEVATRTYALAANGSGLFPVSELLDGMGPGNGSIEITATAPVTGFALYDNLKSGGYYYSGIRAVVADN